MITITDYFAGYADHPGITDQHLAAADTLLARVNALLVEAVSDGVTLTRHPVTQSYISTDDGGWRPRDSHVGAWNSSHKEGAGIDVADRDGELNEWLTDDILARHGLYRDHPSATRRWCHLTTRAPRSGRRSFYP